MEFEVKWGNHPFKADAKKVYLEITSIGDDVKPQEIVDYAEENPDSELYKCFTWDDDIAADKWRLQEARQIACNLIVKYEKEDPSKTKPTEVRVLHRCSTAMDAGYKPLPKIVRNDDWYHGLLLEAKSSLKSFRDKYSILSELKPIFELIDEL